MRNYVLSHKNQNKYALIFHSIQIILLSVLLAPGFLQKKGLVPSREMFSSQRRQK